MFFNNMIFPNVAYSNEIPMGFQPHTFVETREKDPASPFSLSEGHMHTIIGNYIHVWSSELA